MQNNEEASPKSVISEEVGKYDYQSGVTLNYYPGMGLFTLMVPLTDEQGKVVEGLGVTWRDLDGMNHMIPGIRERILAEKGKVVILGNGLSLAAEELQALGGEGSSSEPMVLIDLFNYPLLLADLKGVAERLTTQKITPVPGQLRNMIQLAERLVALGEQGKVKLIKYLVGSGNIPEEARNAALVINIVGPNIHTLSEQIEFLVPGGQLYIHQISKDIAIPENCTRRYIGQEGGPAIITKNS